MIAKVEKEAPQRNAEREDKAWREDADVRKQQKKVTKNRIRYQKVAKKIAKEAPLRQKKKQEEEQKKKDEEMRQSAIREAKRQEYLRLV